MAAGDPHDWADAIRALAPWAATVRTPGFTFGTWHDMERRAEGVSTLPWFELSAEGSALLAAAGGFLLPDFAWAGCWIGSRRSAGRGD